MMNRYFLLILLLFLVIDLSFAQDRRALGKLTNSKLTEVSGITPYSFKDGYFWVHNDSGDKANLYLIDTLGKLTQIVNLKGVKAIDWEDISRINYKNESYLVVGDIGNNLKNRDTLSIYILKEPKIDLSKNTNDILHVDKVKQIKFTYTDKNHDAEALFVDPISNNIYIATKRDFKSLLFKLPFDLKSNETYRVSPLLELPFTFTVSADISFSGEDILIKNLTNIFYWKRNLKESVEQTLSKEAIKIPYLPEPQGEAICFGLNSKSFYTISERPFGLDSYLYFYTF